MSRVTRLLKVLQNEAKSGSEKSNDWPSAESLDMSSIEKTSFLQGEGYSAYGNPLHSTALEDESGPEPEHRHKATAQKPSAKAKRNEVRGVTETPKRSRAAKSLKSQQKSDVQAQEKRRNQTPQAQTDHAPKSQRQQTISENRNNKGKKRAPSKRSGSDGLDNDMSPDAAHNQSRRRPSWSSEDLTDEDESFHPSSEKRTVSRMSLPRSSSSRQPRRGQKQKRKSSSGSSVTDSGYPSKKQKPGGGRNPIALDVVFEAFQEYVTHYKETVSSEVVKKAINAFSLSFEEELTEMITAAKEFNNVKREAVKVNRSLNQKKTRLLESKNELIKSKAELKKIEEEHNELEQRLTALKEGTAFLNNLKTLNRRYLQYCRAHTEKRETYGPYCIPAMLLEARSITGTEQQLKNINDKLQQVLGEGGGGESLITNIACSDSRISKV